jgi:hypothetical protein
VSTTATGGSSFAAPAALKVDLLEIVALRAGAVEGSVVDR